MNTTALSMVTIYSDVMAILLLVGLMLIPRGTGKKDAATGIFVTMALGVIILALGNTVRAALYGQHFTWAEPVALAAQTVSELASVFTVYQWILYVDYKLYGSRDHLKRRFPVLFIPIILLSVILLVNTGTGILFTIGEDISFTPTVMYYFMAGIEFLYLLMAVVFMAVYVARGGKKKFFSTAPVIIPVLLGSVVSLVTDYSARALGLAVGLVFLYFSMAAGWRFGDKNSGFFNKEYLTYLRKTGNAYLGSICFKAAGDASGIEGILKSELPRDSIIIRNDQNSYLFLTETDAEPELLFLAELVKKAADLRDESGHRGKAICLEYTINTRSADQDTGELFLKN